MAAAVNFVWGENPDRDAKSLEWFKSASEEKQVETLTRAVKGQAVLVFCEFAVLVPDTLKANRYDLLTDVVLAQVKGSDSLSHNVNIIRALLTTDPFQWHEVTITEQLHEACILGHTGAALALMKAGAGVITPDKEGKTPLQIAMENGHIELAEEIRKYELMLKMGEYGEVTEHELMEIAQENGWDVRASSPSP